MGRSGDGAGSVAARGGGGRAPGDITSTTTSLGPVACKIDGLTGASTERRSVHLRHRRIAVCSGNLFSFIIALPPQMTRSAGLARARGG